MHSQIHTIPTSTSQSWVKTHIPVLQYSKSSSNSVADSWYVIFRIWFNPLIRILSAGIGILSDCRCPCILISYKVMQCKTCHNNLTLLVLRIVRHSFQHLPLTFGYPNDLSTTFLSFEWWLLNTSCKFSGPIFLNSSGLAFLFFWSWWRRFRIWMVGFQKKKRDGVVGRLSVSSE